MGVGSECVGDRSIAAGVHTARVLGNVGLCRDHYRLTMGISLFREAEPGQFVHVSPVQADTTGYRAWEEDAADAATSVSAVASVPMLRRAYSIAGMRRQERAVEIDIIYRVVGKGTRWLQTLRAGQSLSVLGPQGNQFPIVPEKPTAWLVAGGVGLPPMLWLAGR